MLKNQQICFAILISFLILVLFYLQDTYAAEAVPYTVEAYAKIKEAQKSYKPSRPAKDANPDEKLKAGIDMFRDVYRLAGFDFDMTIRQVAKDLKNGTLKTIPNGENVVTMIIVSLSYVKSHCEYEKVNCLSFFDSKTTEAVQWLWENTGFSP